MSKRKYHLDLEKDGRYKCIRILFYYIQERGPMGTLNGMKTPIHQGSSSGPCNAYDAGKMNIGLAEGNSETYILSVSGQSTSARYIA
jgi:hypothetical protein